MNSVGVEYRDAVGLPGYKVGSDGTVWSSWKTNGLQSNEYRELAGSPCGDGRLRVRIRGRARRWIHHLVLEAFVGPRPQGMEACHFPDPNPGNNHVANLRWDTHAANIVDREVCGNTMRGDSHARAKLTAELVKEYRIRASNGESVTRLAKEAGVRQSVMQQAVCGQTWKHAGGPRIVPSLPKRIDGLTIDDWARRLGLDGPSTIYRHLKRGMSFEYFISRHCPKCNGAGPGEKLCAECGILKSIGQFTLRTGNRDGRMARCNDCRQHAKERVA